MKIEGKGQLLRIFVRESDIWEGVSLFEAILARAREEGIVGATVVRGIEGFGATSRLQEGDMSETPPVVIEIIDAPDRIAKVLPILDEILAEGMVTLEDVHIIAYRAARK